MHDLKNWSFRVRNFKCFEDWQGFDAIYPINLIIGRNNVGKSAVLDIVATAVPGASDNIVYRRRGQMPQYQSAFVVTREVVAAAITDESTIGRHGQKTRDFALQSCIGLRVVATNTPGVPVTFAIKKQDQDIGGELFDAAVSKMRGGVGNPLREFTFIRLRADRDIRPEPAGSCTKVEENGDNATQLVEHYLNESKQHGLVEEKLVGDLNTIMKPDWSFRRLFPKRDGTGKWELFLDDTAGDIIPLSHSGSGVKTILLALINLHLVPHKLNRPLNRFLFCFEELENNLHPAIQRRLFRFVREKAVNEGCYFFLTTHSNAVIDLFSRDDQAQILHVTNDGSQAKVQQVSSYLHQCSVLDDLDVRASDLLQANVLVWVEGPSDRLYFNKWIELWSEGQLQEQVHYQCVWYGGSILADMTFDAPDDPAEALVTALRVNRHAIILMDSDRRAQTDPLKARVDRVLKEVTDVKGLGWVTDGREVENYIPIEALRSVSGKADLTPPAKYADVFAHIGKSRDGKMDLAHKVLPLLTKDMLKGTLDLEARLDDVRKKIREWNGLDAGKPKS